MIRLKSATVLFTLLIFTISCINDIDMDQVDSLNFATPISLSLIHVDLDQFNFLDSNNQEVNHISDESDIHITDFLSHAENNEIVVVSYFTNTIDREFVIEYEFYDSMNQLIMTSESMLIEPNVSNLQYQFSYTYTELENATKVRTTILMLDGLPLRPFLDRNLNINSTINLNYEF